MEILKAFGILVLLFVGIILRQWVYSYRSPVDFFKDFIEDFFKGNR